MDDLPLPQGTKPNINLYPELMIMNPAHLLLALTEYANTLVELGIITLDAEYPWPQSTGGSAEEDLEDANDLFVWIIETRPAENPTVLAQFMVYWVNLFNVSQRHAQKAGGRRRSKKKRSKKKGSKKKRSKKRRYKRKSRKY